MARSLRLEYPDAVYHATSQSNALQIIVMNGEDWNTISLAVCFLHSLNTSLHHHQSIACRFSTLSDQQRPIPPSGGTHLSGLLSSSILASLRGVEALGGQRNFELACRWGECVILWERALVMTG